MLDENAPRALQQYIGFEDDQVHIDISKCYPNTLINNLQPIPLYSIRKSKLSKLRGFGNQLVLKAGFYSQPPTAYLVHKGLIDKSRIAYMVLPRRALKPNTYSEFMLRLFIENNDKVVKNLANSFIGALGRKYDKQNFGVVCGYETAMGCWCEGSKNGDHITITSNEESYLIRNQKVTRIMEDHTSINTFVVS